MEKFKICDGVSGVRFRIKQEPFFYLDERFDGVIWAYVDRLKALVEFLEDNDPDSEYVSIVPGELPIKECQELIDDPRRDFVEEKKPDRKKKRLGGFEPGKMIFD